MNSDFAAWLVFGLAALLVGFVSAAEAALSAASPNAIRKLSEAGNRRAAQLDALLSLSTQFWLTAMLVKTAGLLAAGVALVQQVMAHFSLLAVIVATVIAWLVLALAQIIGRALVLDNAEKVALQLAPMIAGLMKILSPVTFVLYRTGLRVRGEEEAEDDDSLFLGEDGLRLLMQANHDGSEIEESEKEIIANILEMDDTVAREVMVPRIDMVTLSVESSLRTALDVIMEAGHSRIPVYEDDEDHMIGLLYAKDLLRCFRESRPDAPIRELLRPAYFVPASKKLNPLLREMQQQRIHLALVVDEYGGIAGLITIEDIIEEIFGEIQDEFDIDQALLIQAIGDESYLINARCDMGTLAKLLDIEADEVDADTLGGLIYSVMGHVPERGEAIEFDGWGFCVITIDGRRIEQVRVEKISDPTGAVTATAHAAHTESRTTTLNPSSLPNNT